MVAATTALFFPLQRRLDTLMESWQRQTIAAVEKRFGYTINYERIRPTILVRLEIFNARMSDGSDTLLSLQRLSVKYNIIRLLRGDIEGAVSKIILVNTTLHIDAEKDSKLLSIFSSDKPQSKTSLTAAPSPRLPSVPDLTIRGNNVNIDYSSSRFSLSVENLFFSLQGGQSPHFSSRGRITFSLKGAEQASIATPFQALITAEGTWKSSDTAGVTIGLRDLQSPFMTIPTVRFHASLDGETLIVEKAADRIPLDLSLRHDFSESATQLEILSEAFVPSSFLSLRGDYDSINPWLRNSYSGKMEVRYDKNHSRLTYSTDMAAQLRYISGVELPFPLNHHVQIAATGDEKGMKIDLLRVTSSDMDFRLSGTALFSPLVFDLDFDIGRLAIDENLISGKGRLSYNRDGLVLTSDHISYNDIKLSKLETWLSFDSAGSSDFSLRMTVPDENSDKQGHIAAEGEFRWKDSFYLESSLSIQSVPLANFYSELQRRGVEIPSFLPPPYLDMDGFFSTDKKRLSYSVVGLRITDGSADHYLSLSGAGTLDEHTIRNFDLRWGDYVAGGSSTFYIRDQALLAESDITVNQISYGFTAYYNFGKSLVLSGDHGSRLIARFKDDGLYLAAEADAFPLPIKLKEAADLSFSLHGRYRSPSSWRLVVDTFRFTSFFAFEGSGSIGNNAAFLTNISYQREGAPLRGSISASYPDNSPLKAQGWVSLSDPKNEETYLGAFSLDPNGFSANFDIQNAPLSRFTIKKPQGKISGKLIAKGPYRDPDFSVDLALAEGQQADKPLELEVRAEKKGSELQLKYGRGRFGNHIFQKISGLLMLNDGHITLSGEYRPYYQKKLQSVGFLLEGQTAPVNRLSALADIAQSPLSMGVTLDPILTSDGTMDSQHYELKKEEGTISVTGGPQEAINGYYRKGGDFYLGLSDPLPIVGNVNGHLVEKEISADISLESADLSLLDGIADIGFFALHDGRAEGSLHIEGSINDPSFSGAISIQEARASSSLFPNELSLFDAYVRMTDKEVSLIAEPIRSGNATLDVSLGLVIERWLPRNYSITIRPEGENGVKTEYAISGGGVDVTGYTRGIFEISGSATTLNLSGDLVLNDASITLQNKQNQKTKSNQETKQRRKRDFTLDLKITSGKRVEFFWPTINFPILRSFAETEQSVIIRFDSAERSFGLKGSIGIQGGEISYLQRNFLITKGDIEFNENADRFDPRLSVEAVLREIDDDGKPLKIYLTVDDQPLSKFEPKFSSDPAMSDAEIITILGASLPSRIGSEAIDLTTSLALTGSLVTQLGIIGTFESRVKDVLNVDLFSIRTQMIQNLIIDRLGSALGNEDYEGSDLSQYLDNTTIFLGKYFGNDLFIQGTLQIQANQVTDQIVNKNDLYINSEISLEWKTPLFLLELAIEPDFENPIDTLDNTSLGLSWSFSY
ncbi:translocation/assembly module TamB domain-containing protein [Sediminispirochaeta bajacaliforniensis]|uniref:translocation/assembly module TamB domain-containing protein n=1 Tax=Sediminispirochaeta bajacaliforniensis TaxID=148 RepID=UPI000399D3BF|nr:translocation/assembly module TamB domain-containing protein [Sediminispirochaeta bajacaliforniensis]